MYPDQSLYPVDSVPAAVRRINHALLRADQVQTMERHDGVETTDHDFLAPIIADAEAGFGGPLNAFELAKALIEAGAAAVHFEDQLASEKKCGHLGGKVLVPTATFIRTLNAARLASDVLGVPTLIMARTDANATEGLDEAIIRARTFVEMGVDITFLEAPRDEDEMRAYCEGVPGPKMANMVEQGDTPVLPSERLAAIGYKIVIYPITLMLAGMRAMEDALSAIKAGRSPEGLAEFAHLREIVGFPQYYEAEKKYAVD